MISANGITKYFGDLLAVDNVSFTIRDGEITGLLGPNGAGKTTTLRMLTCYLKPDSGTVMVGDYLADKNPLEIKKIIGYLPETAPIYGDMLVYDYLNYVSEIRGIEDSNRIREIGELCGINEVMHRSINEISRGYKQRVGLAYVMIHDPDVLILDEPTSGLDPNQIIEIRNLIKEIGRRKTIILSTHILSEVEATCDRVIIIDKGQIVADDRMQNLQASSGKEKIISIKVGGTNFPSLSEKIKGLDGIADVIEEPDNELVSVSITVSKQTDIRPNIFKLITDNNWVLYEMIQKQLSLENVFRKLTTGGENE